MINVDEQIIDKFTEVFYRILKGEKPCQIELPQDYPNNEIRQLSEYINLFIKEYNDFSEIMFSLSAGELDYYAPPSKMRVVQSFKSLQSNLKHLTWKTQQIASGDFAQRVDFMGDFSAAFNKMTEQLKDSFLKLEKLNATKDKFFSIIAHDLKNPFTGLLGLSEFLRENARNLAVEEISEIAGQIYESSSKAFKLLENLLNWSRAQTGQIDYYPIVFRINDLIDETIELLQPQAQNTNIHLVKDVCEDLYCVADKNMISAVIRNLATNALKFTRVGGRIDIIGKKNNELIEITVKDNGIGLSEKDMLKLFRIDVKNTEIGASSTGKGTGLGLILCKEFIEKNNGRIYADGAPDKGCAFTFTIPAAQ